MAAVAIDRPRACQHTDRPRADEDPPHEHSANADHEDRRVAKQPNGVVPLPTAARWRGPRTTPRMQRGTHSIARVPSGSRTEGWRKRESCTARPMDPQHDDQGDDDAHEQPCEQRKLIQRKEHKQREHDAERIPSRLVTVTLRSRLELSNKLRFALLNEQRDAEPPSRARSGPRRWPIAARSGHRTHRAGRSMPS